MTQGYERGVEAKKVAARVRYTFPINPYPEWCAEHKRFQAAIENKPDPNEAS